MIKLVKDIKAGWWIESWDEKCEIDDKCCFRSLNITAEEVLDLNNQIMKLLIDKNLCPKCLEPMVKFGTNVYECKKHSGLLVSKG